MIGPDPGSSAQLIRRSFEAPWDDLDVQGCIDHGPPLWTTMIVVGPTKVRDAHGNVSLHWAVSVQCDATAPEGTLTAPVSRPEPAASPGLTPAA